MQVQWFKLAAMVVALSSLAHVAQAQYGPNPYGGYPAMPGYGQIMPVGHLQGVQACEAPSCTMAPGCGTACPTNCGPACGCDDCCGGGYCNKFSVFADFLYLRPRNAEVAYTVPINSIAAPDDPIVQVGPVQTINPDYQPGFRGGFSYTLDECSLIQATYSQLDSDSTNGIVLNGNLQPVLLSLVSSPSPINATDTWLAAQADQSIQFKLVDVDYKGLFAYCCDYRVAYVVGARYAQMEQNFNALFEDNGFNAVNSNVQFHGAGLRFGLEGERYTRNNNFFGYGRAVASLIGGEFKTSYTSLTQATAPGDVTSTSWRAGRLVTTADIEVGLGWQNHCGNIRLQAGYMYSMWYNMVKNQEWINSVQQNNFTDPSDNYAGFMSFDGLTTRIEYLW